MDRLNGRIIFSTLILMGVGIYRLQISKNASGTQLTLTRILVGAYLLAIIASILDLAGGQVSEVVGGIMMLAVFSALLLVIPDVFQRINAYNNRRDVKRPPTKRPPNV